MPRSSRTGLTYVEVLVSLVILATAVTASLRTLGGFARGQRAWDEQSKALELANQLMAEINTLPFADPAGSSGIGLEAGEVLGNRTTYDDIDDYNAFDESPPRDVSNMPLSGYDGFRRQVSVVYDNPLAATGLTFEAGSFKKITVTVSKDGRQRASLVTIRANHHANS